MRRWYVLAGLLLTLAGCASPTPTERARLYNEDGVHLYAQGDYAQARESFRAALQLTPEDVGLIFNIAETYEKQGALAEAERYYYECLDRSPNHVVCRHTLATLLVRQNRWQDASRMVADWLQEEPALSAAHAEDGWLFLQAGDLPRAQARFQKALELDPRNMRALTELAGVYETLNRPDRALVLYERALAAEPKQPAVEERLKQLKEQGVGRPRPD